MSLELLAERRTLGTGSGLLVGPFVFFAGMDSEPVIASSGSRARFRPDEDLVGAFASMSTVDLARLVIRQREAGMVEVEVQRSRSEEAVVTRVVLEKLFLGGPGGVPRRWFVCYPWSSRSFSNVRRISP